MGFQGRLRITVLVCDYESKVYEVVHNEKRGQCIVDVSKHTSALLLHCHDQIQDGIESIVEHGRTL